MTASRSTAVATILAICLLATADAEQNERGDIPLKILVERLESDDVKTRKEAAEVLEMRSAGADAGMGGVSGLLGDDDDVATMERFRSEARPLVSVLIKLLLNAPEEGRVAAARVLGAIGPDAEASRSALRKVIRDGKNSRGLRLVAVPALLSVTPARETAGREFLDGFFAACGSDSDDVKAADEGESSFGGDETFAGWYGPLLAAMLIGAGRTSMEIPSLVEVTPAAFPRRLRLTAITALAVLEAEARKAVPALRQLLDDNDSQVRQFAGLAILHIEGEAAEIPSIMQAMALDKRGNDKFLEEANDLIQRKKEASKQIQEARDEIVPLALPMLRHRNSFHQRQTIRLLRDIGPPAKEAVPELKKLLKSNDKETRAAATEALKAIEGAGAPADTLPSKSKAH